MSKPTVRYNAGPGSWLDWLLRRRRLRWHTYAAQVGPDGTYEWVNGEPIAPGTPLPWGDPSHDVAADVRNEIRRRARDARLVAPDDADN